jgi:hypothetical protein
VKVLSLIYFAIYDHIRLSIHFRKQEKHGDRTTEYGAKLDGDRYDVFGEDDEFYLDTSKLQGERS